MRALQKMALYPAHTLGKLHSFIFFSSSKVAKWMIPYVCNLFPVCGGLFYNHLQAADTWRNCSPLASTLRVCCPRAILDPFQSAQGVWSLLKHSRRPHLISASVKLVPIYLAESKGTHQGVVTVLENEGVEKNQKVTLEGKESLRSIKGSRNVSSSIDPT